MSLSIQNEFEGWRIGLIGRDWVALPSYLFGRSAILLRSPERDLDCLSALIDIVERLRMYLTANLCGCKSSRTSSYLIGVRE